MVVGIVVVGIVALVVLIAVLVVALHWYVWRRLIWDTTVAGSPARRAGTAIVVAGPVLLVGATVAEIASAPFALVRLIAWPGYLWGALLVYMLLALAIGEPIRRLLLRRYDRDESARESDTSADRARSAPASDPVSVDVPASDSDTSADRVRPGPVPVAMPDGAAAQGSGGGASDKRTPPGPARDSVSATHSGVRVDRARSESEPGPVGDGVPAVEPGTAASDANSVSAPGPVRNGASSVESGAAAGHGQSVAASDPVPGDAAANGPDAPAAARLPRRIFISRVVSGAAVAAAATTVGVGAYGVLNGPSVKHVTVPLAKLPRRADGFRIAVVSDVHLGPILGRGFAERVVRIVNDTQPDLIAVVGDLVDGSVEHLRSAVEPLARLRARHGAFFVTGNHEYFSGAEQWVEHVQELGMHLLANARTELPGFDLAGVNDVQGERTGQGPDFGKALGDRDRARTAVLLAHQPVLIEDAVAHGVDLQLSGHTHGGQIWPGNYFAALANPTVAGLERYGDTQLYVSRGAGAWGPPVRVGAPSDITVVELASLQA
ncbi:metallophosphoesterase [Nocardia asteroides]